MCRHPVVSWCITTCTNKAEKSLESINKIILYFCRIMISAVHRRALYMCSFTYSTFCIQKFNLNVFLQALICSCFTAGDFTQTHETRDWTTAFFLKERCAKWNVSIQHYRLKQRLQPPAWCCVSKNFRNIQLLRVYFHRCKRCCISHTHKRVSSPNINTTSS